MTFASILRSIGDDPDNFQFAKLGWNPIYTAGPHSRIAVIGQAPGRKAQESGVPWNDASGTKLFEWLDVSEQQFRDPELFALLPMDFYFPGKGKSGDLPPRKDFADKWHPQLLDLMPDIRLTLLIGGYSQAHYLAGRTGKNLTETVHSFRDYLPAVIPLVHPSPLNFRWQAKNPWFATDLLPVLKDSVRTALS